MPRPVRGLRPIFVLATLVVALLGLNAAPAFATHYRYGTIYWEKDPQYTIDHPGFYRVRVTFTTGWRWGFTHSILAGSPPPPTGGNRCATPVVGDSPAGGSCPPVGAFINLAGGGIGYIGLDKQPTSVTIVKGQGDSPTIAGATVTAVPGPYQALNPGPYRFLANGQVVSVSPNTDTMYADLTFDLIYPITSNPITVNYWQSNRLSTLRDGNNDQPWQLKAVIDANAPNLRSPIAAALPIISQVNSANFDLLIPLSTQPGTTASLRFATSAESNLINPTPYGMTIDAVNKSLIHWTPQPRVPSNGSLTNPSTGLYSVQFMLRSVGGSGQPVEVPLDLLFNVNASCLQSATCPTVSLTTPGNVTDFEAPIGQNFSTSVDVNVDPFTAGSKIGLTSTPLPPGMSLTLSSQTVNPLTGTLTWLPTLASPENSVVCFQGDVTLPSTVIPIISNGMKCLNFLVVDPNDQPPLATCSATPITVPATGLSGALVSFSVTVAEPNLQATTVTFTEGAATLATGSTAAGAASTNLFLTHNFSIGTHNVVTSAFDGRKTGSCTTQVIVTKKPQSVTFTSATTPLAVGSSRTMEATSESGQPVSFSLVAGSPGTLAGASLTATGLGTIEVKGSAAGNALYEAGQAIVQIATFDNTPPTITVPADITQEAANASGAPVSFTATAIDSVDPSVVVTCAPASGSVFPIATTTVTCNASDAAGNPATATTFTVTVADTTKPVIAPHGNESTPATSPAGAAVTYTPPSTSDVVGGAGAATCSPAPGSTFTLGTHTVTCNATDGAGNAADPTTFTVTVTNNAPTFTPHAAVTVEATAPSGATAIFTAGGTDVEDGPLSNAVCAPASGSTFPVGSTTVGCTVTDVAGATGSGSFPVHVVDTTKPVLSLPSSFTVEAVGAGGAVAIFAASASDIVDVTVPVSCSKASGSVFPPGPTIVSCSATDAHGNTATGSFTVIVGDTTAPAVASVTPSQGSLWPANHQMVPITFAVVRSDTVDPSPVCSITSIVSNEPINGQGDGDTGPDWQFAPGSLTASIRAERAGGGSGRVYTVTVTCRDASGNAASNSTTVSVPKSQGK